jgi:hypothetical protein
MTRQGEKTELALDLMVKMKGDGVELLCPLAVRKGLVGAAAYRKSPILNEHVPIKASMGNQNP